MSFDFKKEYRELYLPGTNPGIVVVPKINYIAVRGKGNPNQADGEYKHSIELIYGVAFTLKMSHKTEHKIPGYFEYVLPPLEGLWWQSGKSDFREIDYSKKEDFNFISIMRVPDFVSKTDFNWAINQVTGKKKQDFSKVEFLSYDEGLCAQCMHLGPYDDEPKTIENIHDYAADNDYEIDTNDKRFHHEIYLSNPQRCRPSNLKTIIRLPIKPKF